MNGAFMFLFTCMWSVIVLVLDAKAARELWKQFESSHYPVTMGQVTHSEVTTQYRSKGGRTYGVDIEYHYMVDGHPFYGSRFRYMTFNNSSDSDYQWATATVNKHPVRSQIQVYFNPGDPQDAVLSPDLSGGDVMALLFLMPFNLVMVGFCTWIGGWLRERILRPEAGGVKIIVEGSQTRVRLPRYGAWLWGMVATGAVSFVSLFVVGIPLGPRISIPAALATLFVAIGAGVGVYIWQWRKIRSGDNDLILDETSTTIALPETFGRKERVTVDRSDIEKLMVVQTQHRGSRGGRYYTYAPTLWLRRSEDVKMQKLADWRDRKRAEAFAEWLRQRLSLTEAQAERAGGGLVD